MNLWKTSETIIIAIFYLVDTYCCDLPQHVQSKLHPSEIVTLALLFRLKGLSYRRFHAWVMSTGLFPKLPNYSRLNRLFLHYQPTVQVLSQNEAVENLAIVDSTGCEVVHPIREKRSSKDWIGKNKSKGRWYVGQKLTIMVDALGRILNWETLPANAHDTRFNDVFQGAPEEVLADFGFKSKDNHPDWLTICERGERNDRMVVESIFSLLKRLLHLDKLRGKTEKGFNMAVSGILGVYNLLLELNAKQGIMSKHPSIAHFCIL
jgi:hypothetical protein